MRIWRFYDKMFIAYGSVINSVGLILAHVIYFASEDMFNVLSPYLSSLFGIQFLMAIKTLRLTYRFNFCSLTKFNDWCYLLICVTYMLFYWLRVPDVYTVVVQTVLASIGLFSFIFLYTKKYSDCWISLYLRARKKTLVIFGIFAKAFIVNGLSCEKALDEFKKNRYNKYLSDEKL